MIENEWWSRHIKPRWHNPIRHWVARKVQDITNKGAPDVDACWGGFQCKVELKYKQQAPASDNTPITFSRYSKDEMSRRTVLSREQVRNLEEWHLAGGHCFVLIGVERAWFLMPFKVVLEYNDGLNLYQLRTWALFKDVDIKTIGIVPDHYSDVGQRT